MESCFRNSIQKLQKNDRRVAFHQLLLENKFYNIIDFKLAISPSSRLQFSQFFFFFCFIFIWVFFRKESRYVICFFFCTKIFIYDLQMHRSIP